jgi:hypothetical protein
MNAYRILVGNPLANRSVVWPSRTWEDIMNIHNSVAKGYEGDVWHMRLSRHCPLSGMQNRTHSFDSWNCFIVI